MPENPADRCFAFTATSGWPRTRRPTTNAGAQFRNVRVKDAHTPGFYLHLEPGGAFMASGLWHPYAPTLAKIRGAIVADPAKWKRVTGSKALRAAAKFTGGSLVRPPRGFDPDHPLIEDLKRKDFIVVANMTEAVATAPGFIGTFAKFCRTAAPYTRLLAEAADLEW